MTTGRPILKIYADEQESHRTLVDMERFTKKSLFISLIFAGIFVYLIVNEIEGFRYLALLFCLLSAGMSWQSYDSTASYLKEYQELPLLYSFYRHGFISHRGGQEYSWEDISTLHSTKTSINLKMIYKSAYSSGFKFTSISTASMILILRHFKTHAPERLSKKITF